MNSRLNALREMKLCDRVDVLDIPREKLLEFTAVLLVIVIVAVATSGAMYVQQSQK